MAQMFSGIVKLGQTQVQNKQDLLHSLRTCYAVHLFVMISMGLL